MRVYFYNKRGDLTLGLAKVKRIKVHDNGSVDLTIMAEDGSKLDMPIKYTDYDTMVAGSK